MNRTILAFVIALSAVSCATTAAGPDDGIFKQPGRYNFKFIGYDAGIKNPENDGRCYYRILINKVEEGRTSTGLESQAKEFEAMLSINRHLLTVEKWVLDEKAGKYVKLNNIDQPRPNYCYFLTDKNRISVVTMENVSGGAARYRVEFEKNN